jgi:RND superfamily putative drug exporter
MLNDLSDQVTSRLLIFTSGGALSFLLLMVVFRSVAMSLKAAGMNLLSIGASYGFMVVVFQWGWGKGLIGLESTIPINPFVPMIVMISVFLAFSMNLDPTVKMIGLGLAVAVFLDATGGPPARRRRHL